MNASMNAAPVWSPATVFGGTWPMPGRSHSGEILSSSSYIGSGKLRRRHDHSEVFERVGLEGPGER